MSQSCSLLIDELVAQGFQGDISCDPDTLAQYATDESIFSITPQLVLKPKDTGDVEKAVRIVRAHSESKGALSLTPRAAGTGLGGGSLNDSVILDVTAYLNQLEEPVTWEEKVLLNVEPGVYFRDVEALLKKSVRTIPVYPASKDICCIGGMIGNNAAGATSLTYGHFAEFIESLDVVLQDGSGYSLRPWNKVQFDQVCAHDNELGRITREVYALIKKHEKTILEAEPKTKKNSAGYALWDVLNVSVEDFEAGKGFFNLARIFAGSQGTLGVVTRATLRTIPIEEEQHLVVVPVFDLNTVGEIIKNLLTYSPYTLELFDDKTFELALKHPSFFQDRLDTTTYPKVLDTLYDTYFNRFGKTIPSFVILASFTHNLSYDDACAMTETLNGAHTCNSFVIENRLEAEMYWQVRRASYSLSKLQDPDKRPAAFLEDMIVPPEHLSEFFTDIKALFKKYDVDCAVHGHGGNGHLHFYPLIDFTDPSTPDQILAMSEDFFEVAKKHEGGICGEHNDGIIRTPYLNKMFSQEVLDIFRELECIFDPHDIFNPGKKVNAKFDLKASMRKVN